MKQSAVCGIIVNDQILLLNRVGKIKGWCVPGGKSDDDEFPIDTAIRETYEETSILISNPVFVGCDTSADDRYCVNIFFKKMDKKLNVITNITEHSEYKWVKIDDINQLVLAGNTGNFINLILDMI